VPSERHGRIEELPVAAAILHVNRQVMFGFAEAPVIIIVHVDKRRYVERLPEPIALFVSFRFVEVFSEYVAVPLMPRRVGYFGHDGFNVTARGVVAEVETDRIKAVAEITQVSQQTDWAPWASA
jgi:hypothetical protein